MRQDTQREWKTTQESVDEIPYCAPTGPYRTPRILHREQKSQLHVTSDCATYIFVAGGQVVSIHFDNKRSQLFYQGHKLDNVPLNEVILDHLYQFQAKLALDPQGRLFHSAYSVLLNNIAQLRPS